MIYNAVLEAGKPLTFDLSTRPNPFNASVEIHAPLAERLEIFDIKGRLVTEILIHGSESAEPLSTIASRIVWQPSESIPSGVYLVRARVGDKEDTQRFVYLI